MSFLRITCFRQGLAGLLMLVGSACVAHAADSTAAPTTAPAPTAWKQAHYVTLSYRLPEEAKGGVLEFYNEVTPLQDVSGTYFCAAGFRSGYFGIQNRPDKKVGIFSVWDTASRKIQDPKQVDEAQRTHPVFVGDGVRASRFGNEGTGGHSDFDCNWELGKTYQFYIRATIKDKNTEYEGWFRDPSSTDGWRHIATFSAPDGGKKLLGLYSFLEDFRRDYKSATEIRRGQYGNGWVRVAPGGPWLPLTQAKFAENKYPTQSPTDLDAGVIGKRFYLQNGGDTKQTTRIGDIMTLPDGALTTPPDAPVIQPTTQP